MNQYTTRNKEAIELIETGRNRDAVSKLQSSLIELLTKELSSGTEESSRHKWNEFRDLVAIGCISVSKSNINLDSSEFDEGLNVMSAPIDSSVDRDVPPATLLCYNLATALSRLQEYGHAIKLYDFIVNSMIPPQPNDTDTTLPIRVGAYMCKGICLFRSNLFPEAIECFKLFLSETIVLQQKSKRWSLLSAAAINNIGLCYLHDDKSTSKAYNYAMECFSKSLNMRRAALGGLNDKDSATVLNNLGRAMFCAEKYKGSLKMYLASLKIRETFLSPIHLDTGATILNAAQAYLSLGNYTESERFVLRFLDISKKRAADNVHEDVAVAMKCLAQVYHRTHRSALALETLNEALETVKKMHHSTHPEVASILNDIATMNYECGKFNEAIDAFKQCLEIDIKIMKQQKSFVNISTTISNLFHILCKAGRFREAVEINLKLIDIVSSDTKVRDDISMIVIGDTWCRIGLAYTKLNLCDKAVDCFEYALDIRIDMFGDCDSNVISLLRTIGDLHMRQRMYNRAVHTFTEYVDILRVANNKKEIGDLANALCLLGRAQIMDGNVEAAYTSFCEALDKEQEKLQKGIQQNKFKIPFIMQEIGKIYMQHHDYTTALTFFQKSLAFCKSHSLICASPHIDIARLYSYIGQLYYSIGDTTEGFKFYSYAIQWNRRHGQSDDDNLLDDMHILKKVLPTIKPGLAPAA